ncbi:hypothetical protein N7494_003051 [Penicillium frequentans]|uniref:Calcineurin-like phosphoesterase domain-containing protein n=1 Tax=Penicillium frequentans TaxID=3151616 RepID=A0AAD6D6S4_9EURO|nr:hypothetical protein N7494_003051 [Penicillium glabrum]
MAETQLQLISDLHLESPAAYDIFHINPVVPCLALIGDIGYVEGEGFSFLRIQLIALHIASWPWVIMNYAPIAKPRIKCLNTELSNTSKREDTPAHSSPFIRQATTFHRLLPFPATHCSRSPLNYRRNTSVSPESIIIKFLIGQLKHIKMRT